MLEYARTMMTYSALCVKTPDQPTSLSPTPIKFGVAHQIILSPVIINVVFVRQIEKPSNGS
jgi:hypothetical protein